jgi:ABC-type dipeptide/oligopeptide/nickel transport system ATPase component
MSTELALEVSGLKTHFMTPEGRVRAVDGVDMKIGKGRTLGVLGESGSGKSVTALSVMRLIDSPGKIVEGRIILDGRDILAISEEEMREVRGKDISMIFQEPMSSLNPVYTLGDQIAEVFMCTVALAAPQRSTAQQICLSKLEFRVRKLAFMSIHISSRVACASAR